jgi:hypothetical protein
LAKTNALSVLLEALGKTREPAEPRKKDTPWTLWLLYASWPRLLALAGAAYLVLVALFAVGYFFCGGVTAQPSSFSDAFFFSIQIFGRVNLGFRMPQEDPVKLLVVCEFLLGWLLFVMLLALASARFMRLQVLAFFSVPDAAPPAPVDSAQNDEPAEPASARRLVN